MNEDQKKLFRAYMQLTAKSRKQKRKLRLAQLEEAEEKIIKPKEPS